jgi:hypothetical protein
MACQPEDIDPTYLQQRARKTLEDQRKLLSSKSKASADPQPGNGVCPISKQYRNTVTKARQLWLSHIADAARNPELPI